MGFKHQSQGKIGEKIEDPEEKPYHSDYNWEEIYPLVPYLK